MVKLVDLKAGDVLVADAGFTCLKPGEHVVQSNFEGGLFVACDEGGHALDGQERDDKHLEGLSRKGELPLQRDKRFYAVTVNVSYTETFLVEAANPDTASDAYYSDRSETGDDMIDQQLITSEIESIDLASDEQIAKLLKRKMSTP
jgi:hypothetical protein